MARRVSDFKTKKALYQFTKERLDSLPKPTVFTPDSPGFDFLSQLLDRHPRALDKREKGVAAFLVDRNVGGTGAITYIRTDDGELIDFSWVTCCNSNSRSYKTRLQSALRAAVADQIDSFRMRRPHYCHACRDRSAKTHVDHIIPFHALYLEFLKLFPDLEPPTVFRDHPTLHFSIFREEDIRFQTLWAEFHRAHAQLQLLCIPCHKDKTREDLKK